MVGIPAETLSEKRVVGSDGLELGTLYNVRMNIKTGDLVDLLVTPADDAPAVDVEQDDHGRYRIPATHVQAVGDHIVVER